jgi:hypothetical protein
VIANLGLSPSFGGIDFDHLVFPAHMRIDYIRVYQSKDAVNTGCDPAGAPTQAYINKFVSPSPTYAPAKVPSLRQVPRGVHEREPDHVGRRLQAGELDSFWASAER